MYVTGANRRKEEVGQEMQRESGLLVNKILIMKMILTWHCDWKCWYTFQLNLCVSQRRGKKIAFKLNGWAFGALWMPALHPMYILYSSPDGYGCDTSLVKSPYTSHVVAKAWYDLVMEIWHTVEVSLAHFFGLASQWEFIRPVLTDVNCLCFLWACMKNKKNENHNYTISC